MCAQCCGVNKQNALDVLIDVSMINEMAYAGMLVVHLSTQVRLYTPFVVPLCLA